MVLKRVDSLASNLFIEEWFALSKSIISQEKKKALSCIGSNKVEAVVS